MKVFLKANTASLIASFCDFTSSVTLHQVFKVPVVAASITGTVIGGIINFIVCRYWAFNTRNMPVHLQVKRYLPTWLGNLLLNSAGVYLLISSGLNYIIAKLITSITVAVAYNYPLQKKYVFKNNE